jgi:hypothetical protein
VTGVPGRILVSSEIYFVWNNDGPRSLIEPVSISNTEEKEKVSFKCFRQRARKIVLDVLLYIAGVKGG